MLNLAITEYSNTMNAIFKISNRKRAVGMKSALSVKPMIFVVIASLLVGLR
jgi:hypothetical protein